MLCDAQIRNDRRIVVLSSIVKIFNSTTTPLTILTIDSVDLTKHKKIATVDVNDEYNLPLNLLYAHANSPVFFTVAEWDEFVCFFRIVIFSFRDENDETITDFISFDWEKEFSTERKLKLKNGKYAHFIVKIVDLFVRLNRIDRIYFRFSKKSSKHIQKTPINSLEHVSIFIFIQHFI